jgi:hypothetical protein
VQAQPGATLIETPSAVAAGTCSVTWLINGQAGPFDVTISQVGPAGFNVRRLAVFHTDPTRNVNHEDPLGCEGTAEIPTSTVVTIDNASQGAAVWFKQCAPLPPPPPPPPPPGDCSGLTPGFWKNWANHYSGGQFALLIDGTSTPDISNAAATTVLGGNNPALTRLKKFLLANELTLSLTANPALPNPSEGSLTLTCSIAGSSLGDALTLARAIIAANGVGYTNQQILNAGTVLDAFANMN